MSIRTCSGCRAYKQLRSGNPNGYSTRIYGHSCELGFDLEELTHDKITTDLVREVTYKHKPKNGCCPKPKTVRYFIECLNKTLKI